MDVEPGGVLPGTPGELRHRLANFLATHEVGVLVLGGADAAWGMPVLYRSQGLAVACLVPRWAEVDVRLAADTGALLIVSATPGDNGRWLACRGTAHVLPPGAWPDASPSTTQTVPAALYDVVGLTLHRLDLVDERAGWGRRENLDL